MSGIGNRFRERGYDTQKYLLPIFEKPIIKYVLDLFPETPPNYQFLVVCKP